MAIIDYGALAIVDGKLINEGQFFMKTSDTGYMINSVIGLDGNTHDIKDNYFAYLGDEDLLVCCYKWVLIIVSKGKVVKEIWGTDFSSETYLIGDTELEISHLDKNKYKDSYTLEDSLKDNLKWFKEYRPQKEYKRALKQFISYKRHGKEYMYFSNKFIARWKHNGKNYELIFGNGIDSDKDCYIRITSDNDNLYMYTEIEKEYIDKVFGINRDELNLIHVEKMLNGEQL